MKLRFRGNSLRLRVNQREVEGLAGGAVLEEQIHFPGDDCMSYVLEARPQETAEASFRQGVIRVTAPQEQVRAWATGEAIGLYFDLPANGTSLRVAIEKDLECVDEPAEERDPHAYPRTTSKNC